jgi:hypothetical protein
LKKILSSLLLFFSEWFKNNQDNIKEYLWQILIDIVKETREHERNRRKEK